jgi:hypothetical protein
VKHKTVLHQLPFVAIIGMLVLMVFLLPMTPDELNRLEHAQSMAKGHAYDFFWPPLSVYVIHINPFQDWGPYAVRLFNLACTLPVFFMLRRQLCESLNWVPVLLVLPYMAFAVSNASQQGLMVCLLGVLLLQIDWPMPLKAVLTALCFALNPTLIVVMPLAILLAWRVLPNRRDFLLAFVVAYVLLLPLVGYIYTSTGKFLPALSGNGGSNLFLGNNPNEMSHRGVGDMATVIAQYGLPVDAKPIQVVWHFFADDPVAFVANGLKKLVLFFSPTDYFRSGLGAGKEVVLFAYIGFCQLVIYAVFGLSWRRQASRSMCLALCLMLAAWLVYSVFFVKVRFRIPFDCLLLLSVLPHLRFNELWAAYKPAHKPTTT